MTAEIADNAIFYVKSMIRQGYESMIERRKACQQIVTERQEIGKGNDIITQEMEGIVSYYSQWIRESHAILVNLPTELQYQLKPYELPEDMR